MASHFLGTGTVDPIKFAPDAVPGQCPGEGGPNAVRIRFLGSIKQVREISRGFQPDEPALQPAPPSTAGR